MLCLTNLPTLPLPLVLGSPLLKSSDGLANLTQSRPPPIREMTVRENRTRMSLKTQASHDSSSAASDTNVNRTSEEKRTHAPLFTAHRQPVPGLPSSYSSMNSGGYPSNSSPFTGHPPSGSPFPHHPPNTTQGSPTNSTDVPQQQYGYANYGYPGHSYPQYPQYPQPIMMYGPPRTQEPPHGPTSPPTSQQQNTSSSSSGKRKSEFTSIQ